MILQQQQSDVLVTEQKSREDVIIHFLTFDVILISNGSGTHNPVSSAIVAHRAHSTTTIKLLLLLL